MQQQLTQNKQKFSVVIKNDCYKNLINQTLGDHKRSLNFIASIMSAVAVNKGLQECDAGSILSGALLGESLNLSPSPQLGQYYLVPYGKQAQFQIGYKGYIQLAIRSGQYKNINVLAIKEGELKGYDPLFEEIEVELLQPALREQAKTIGYYAMFKLINGFIKNMYWTYEKMHAHAIRYSTGFKARKGYTFWEKDFDSMALKTMLRQLLSKWGIMSLELQKAYEYDMAVVKEDGSKDYVDNKNSKGGAKNLLETIKQKEEINAEDKQHIVLEQVKNDLEDLGI